MKQFLDVISEAYPNLNITSARFDDGGMNNSVLIINEDLVFRFPRYAQGLKKLMEEAELLVKLKGLLPLPIPEPSFSSFTNPQQGFCGYKLLPGQALKPSEVAAAPGLAKPLAVQLGTFLNQLHSLPLRELVPDARPREHLAYWQQFHNRVKDKLYSYMRPEASRQVEETLAIIYRDNFFPAEDVLIHGDFGPSNILWDQGKGIITGIIDFGSAGSGDPAQDMAALMGPRGYGIEFVRLMLDSYPGLEALIPRAQFYNQTFALQDALHGLAHNDRAAFQEGIAPYV